MEFLFDRLMPSPLRPRERMRESVLAQLRWLVGSREWQAERGGTALVDICLPEVPSVAATRPEMARWAARLEALIAVHEPRLRAVKVALEPTGQVLSPYRVVVAGRLEGEGEESGEELSVRFDSDRRPVAAAAGAAGP